MFVDASAIVAIIAREPGYERLADALDAASCRLTSGIAVVEATLSLHRQGTPTLMDAEQLVEHFREIGDIALVPIDERETRIAIDAYARFGKGQGHPARLNMGDCFAYACARSRDVPLLFVGNDFSRTDIRSAFA